jgi:ribosomal protein S18 acetylase RimI-like enzyme
LADFVAVAFCSNCEDFRQMYQIRFGRFSDYPILQGYDEFIGDRRLDLQAGEIVVADGPKATAIGYFRISSGAFLGWPLLTTLCVSSDYRRRGVGEALIAHAVNDVRFTRLFTSTEVENMAMRTLLTKAGAQEIGHVDCLNLNDERELLFRLK